MAQALGVPANRVVAKVKRLGGGFGGKETRSVQVSGICAVAAKKMNRPVRCMLNRDEDMRTSGARHPFLAYWKVGVKNDGKLVALDVDIYCNGGWTQDLSAAVCDRALSHVDGVYNFPNVDVRGRPCRTNTVSNTAFRGFGGPQGMFIAETYMEEVADHLGIPVDKFRVSKAKQLQLRAVLTDCRIGNESLQRRRYHSFQPGVEGLSCSVDDQPAQDRGGL